MPRREAHDGAFFYERKVNRNIYMFGIAFLTYFCPRILNLNFVGLLKH